MNFLALECILSEHPAVFVWCIILNWNGLNVSTHVFVHIESSLVFVRIKTSCCAWSTMDIEMTCLSLICVYKRINWCFHLLFWCGVKCTYTVYIYMYMYTIYICRYKHIYNVFFAILQCYAIVFEAKFIILWCLLKLCI